MVATIVKLVFLLTLIAIILKPSLFVNSTTRITNIMLVASTQYRPATTTFSPQNHLFFQQKQPTIIVFSLTKLTKNHTLKSISSNNKYKTKESKFCCVFFFTDQSRCMKNMCHHYNIYST